MVVSALNVFRRYCGSLNRPVFLAKPILKPYPLQTNLINAVFLSVQANKTQGELYLINKLKTKIPDSTVIEVRDVSGGCGQMYEVYVTSPSFKGKPILQQHKMVTEALKEDIAQFHGIRVETSSC